MALEKADFATINKYVRETVQRLPPRAIKAVGIGRLIGTPEADTPPPTDDSGRLATTSYVQTAISSLANLVSSATQVFAGGVQSSNRNSGVGYTTGAGASVTQTTSKATAVTITSVTGQITMVNTALAAGASAVFSMTNTDIGPNDVVIVNLAAGFATTGTYSVQVLNTGSGGIHGGIARIQVTNISAGSLSEALVLNFVVIKGSPS